MQIVRIVQGYTRDLGLPEGWEKEAQSGKGELYNAPRPFPAHKYANGEFVHGIFYGMIDPNEPDADELRKEATSLDAYKLVFITHKEVEEWASAFCEEHDLRRRDYTYAEVVRSYLYSREREDNAQAQT